MIHRNRHWRGVCAALLVWTGALATIRAHPTATDQVVRLFVLPHGAQTTVLLRIPVGLLSEARLPADTDGHLQVAGADQVLRAVAADAAANLELEQDGVRLPATAMRAVLSPASDASFDSATLARDHLQRGTPPDLDVTADQAVVDVELTYAASPNGGEWSGRLNTFRNTSQTVRTMVAFESGAGDPRRAATSTFELTGAPVRVSFNPDLAPTMRDFARRTFGILASRADWLLFLICLIAGSGTAAREPSAVRLTAALLIGQFLAVWAVRALGGIAPETGATASLLAASVIGLVALQNIVDASRWQSVLSVCLGVLTGIGLADEYGRVAQFAGTHQMAGLTVFCVALFVIQLWAVFVLASVTALTERVAPARAIAMLLAIIVLHQALHAMADRADTVAQLAALNSERILLDLTVFWALVVVGVGVVDGIRGRRRPAELRLGTRGSHPA